MIRGVFLIASARVGIVFLTKFERAKFMLLEVSEDVLGHYRKDLELLDFPPHLEDLHPRRALEFKLGRLCAHLAHKELTGKALTHLGVGEKREPLWPSSIVGSLSHTKGLVCAVVGYQADIEILGIDLEVWPRVRADLKSQICCEGEVESLKASGLSEEQLLTLIFSAKESLYKALYPRVQKYFGFKAAKVQAVRTHSSLRSGQIEIKLIESLSKTYGPQGEDIFAVNYERSENLVLCWLEKLTQK